MPFIHKQASSWNFCGTTLFGGGHREGVSSFLYVFVCLLASEFHFLRFFCFFCGFVLLIKIHRLKEVVFFEIVYEVLVVFLNCSANGKEPS